MNYSSFAYSSKGQSFQALTMTWLPLSSMTGFLILSNVFSYHYTFIPLIGKFPIIIQVLHYDKLFYNVPNWNSSFLESQF
ncbi:unnamed protein product [Allacma fusca]|uniref:Uncharacterized protein n=1 Tax=Allacma fusca TaxID=39272 RepID=A0A8J2PQM6_9HEXA|nr:unnamed protein product [Allacma fusca]